LVENGQQAMAKTYKNDQRALNYAKPGEFVTIDPPAPSWGKIALAAVAVAILVATVVLLTGCISVRH
jgi:cytochrome c-type biogenesis protein CcmH/NrfF